VIRIRDRLAAHLERLAYRIRNGAFVAAIEAAHLPTENRPALAIESGRSGGSARLNA
jgi:hypothetical protein